jgi:hypothetical protein
MNLTRREWNTRSAHSFRRTLSTYKEAKGSDSAFCRCGLHILANCAAATRILSIFYFSELSFSTHKEPLRQFDNWQKQCYFCIVNLGFRPAVGALLDMSGSDEVIARAKKRLARRTDVSDEKIVVKHVERVTWPDASLGCPQKGRMYAQVLTPGYRLVLSSGTTDFEYHTDDYRRVVLYRGSKQSKGGGVT